MAMTTTARALALGLMLALSGTALGQAEPDPGKDPGLNDESIDRVLDEQKERARDNTALSPEPGVESAQEPLKALLDRIPDLAGRDRRLRVPDLLPEGAYVTRRAGRLHVLAPGRSLFVFEDASEESAPGAMVLVPGMALERMEASVAGGAGGAALFLVSGVVHQYRGMNFVSPTLVRPLVVDVPEGGEPTVAEDGNAASRAPITEGVAEVIRQLEQVRAIDARGLERPGVDPGSDSVVLPTYKGVLPEGKMFVRRAGRVLRRGDGEWTFIVDSGPEASGVKEPPMILVPCALLEELERVAERFGDSVDIELSGSTLLYKGRNYVTPILYQVLPESELVSQQ